MHWHGTVWGGGVGGAETPGEVVVVEDIKCAGGISMYVYGRMVVRAACSRQKRRLIDMILIQTLPT